MPRLQQESSTKRFRERRERKPPGPKSKNEREGNQWLAALWSLLLFDSYDRYIREDRAIAALALPNRRMMLRRFSQPHLRDRISASPACQWASI